jgi:hypothetical protein
MNGQTKAPSFPKVDKRLLGKWKLDTKRTLKEWTWKKGISPGKKKSFGKILGKLTVTYTRTRIILTKRETGWHSERRYCVVAADDSSVVVVRFGETRIKNRRRYNFDTLGLADRLFPSKPAVSHIHFEEDRYWISYGKNREFFRKIGS